jgi:hypothetical protein
LQVSSTVRHGRIVWILAIGLATALVGVVVSHPSTTYSFDGSIHSVKIESQTSVAAVVAAALGVVVVIGMVGRRRSQRRTSKPASFRPACSRLRRYVNCWPSGIGRCDSSRCAVGSQVNRRQTPWWYGRATRTCLSTARRPAASSDEGILSTNLEYFGFSLSRGRE